MNTTETPFVDIRDLTVTFTGGKSPVKAVNGVTLALDLAPTQRCTFKN
jgi:peptide/nickel transport system ATP-binding protein